MQLSAQRQPHGHTNLGALPPAAVMAVVCATFAGCASPGPPLPPSLNLPEIPAARSLRAVRVGNTVRVSFTAPQRTVDRLLIKAPVQAEICRELAGTTGAALQAAAAQRQPTGRESQTGATDSPSPQPCAPVVATITVKPGTLGEAVDSLPQELSSGPPRLLLYRVQLKNASGRTAGASAAVAAAAGDAPAGVESFQARPAKAGVILEWTPEKPAAGDTVELERAVAQEGGTAEAAGAVGKRVAGSLLASPKTPAKVNLVADAGAPGDADPGGMVDRSAEMGKSYRYTAWRVRTVTIGGRNLEIRGAASNTVTVTVKDVFPPDAPQGLVAAPGFSGPQSAAKPAIDLSWEPNAEPRIAGYRVYRRDAAEGEWHRVSGIEPLRAATYRDTAVTAGARYAYRVTAVGLNQLESPPSSAVEQAAGEP